MTDDILLIPGPIVISKNVQAALGTPSVSHTSAEFASTFSSALKNVRKVFKAGDSGQPVVLAGSGTLGWDIAASNLVQPGDKVLVLSTGFFSDSFAECLKVYGADVDKITAPLGDAVPLDAIRDALSKVSYNMITITHVDTSTAVLTELEPICKAVKELSPETLIVVDGVCSIGCEVFEFEKWGIDYALTASQKALGVPPGLSVSMLSDRAVKVAQERPFESSFFASLKRWLPIMVNYEQGKPAYFATPAVQLVNALDVSLREILDQGIDARVAKHKQTSDWIKAKLTKELGLKLVSVNDKVSAHGLTAAYTENPPKVISGVKQHGIVIAGGIHKQIKDKYIRIGHMGVSACDDSRQDMEKCFEAIKESL
ncbi:LAFE_0B08922g1_1 [Lachancea fermentati]|uniref:alanine--glyoxylate transaminase n=1 Tax=Lachancea fermentati TaxID=4955 RepID=A0A1G4M8B2_LACFM|nr:LAFE_0B08922g1_1 [Lachancea fermentati]